MAQQSKPLVYDRELESVFWKTYPCGDHSIVSDALVKQVLDRHCDKGANDVTTTEQVNSLDGRRQAELSMARGDYRIGAVWPNFPPPPGKSPWETPGIICRALQRDNFTVFSAGWDSKSPQRSVLEFAIWRFLEVYNSHLISDRRFPKKTRCRRVTRKGGTL